MAAPTSTAVSERIRAVDTRGATWTVEELAYGVSSYRSGHRRVTAAAVVAALSAATNGVSDRGDALDNCLAAQGIYKVQHQRLGSASRYVFCISPKSCRAAAVATSGVVFH